jgi:hypothetical protein
MPCYDGSREDARIDRETAKKVEAALCAVITAFGGRRVFHEIDFTECGVTMEWLDRWWEDHQRKDAARKKMDAASKEAARKQAILDSGDYKVLHAMIKKQADILPTVASILSHVPPGSETIARRIQRHQGYGPCTSVMCAWRRSILSRASWSGAPLFTTGRSNNATPPNSCGKSTHDGKSLIDEISKNHDCGCNQYTDYKPKQAFAKESLGH